MSVKQPTTSRLPVRCRGQAFNEQFSVRIQHDLGDARIIQCNAELIAKRFLKLAHESRTGSKLCRGCLL